MPTPRSYTPQPSIEPFVISNVFSMPLGLFTASE
jgi:hypothetical protein